MKIYCNVCNKYRKSKKTKTSYIFEKILSLSKEEESVELSKIIGLIINIEENQKINNHVWRKHKSRV